MLGGDLSFTSGGYARSPVADVLPVDLLDDATPERLISLDPFKPALTPAAAAHPITALKLETRDNAARWQALPPLDGANLVDRARQGATVLLAHPYLRGGDGKPLPVLTVADVGKGRSLAFASDSSWRWGFGAAGKADADEEMRGRWYQKFWENAIRWLIKDPELRFLRVETDQSEYRRGDRVRVTVKALEPDYRPARDLPVMVSVSRVQAGGGAVAVAPKTVRTDENGEASLDLDPFAPGGYRVTARAEKRGSVAVHQDDEVFLVRGGGRELADAEARDDLFREIAKVTGGDFRGPDDDLAGLRFREPEVVRVNKHQDLELWSTWITLVAAALLLSLEWGLRRRWGLH